MKAESIEERLQKVEREVDWQQEEIKRINRHIGALLGYVDGSSFSTFEGVTVVVPNEETNEEYLNKETQEEIDTLEARIEEFEPLCFEEKIMHRIVKVLMADKEMQSYLSKGLKLMINPADVTIRVEYDGEL